MLQLWLWLRLQVRLWHNVWVRCTRYPSVHSHGASTERIVRAREADARSLRRERIRTTDASRRNELTGMQIQDSPARVVILPTTRILK